MATETKLKTQRLSGVKAGDAVDVLGGDVRVDNEMRFVAWAKYDESSGVSSSRPRATHRLQTSGMVDFRLAKIIFFLSAISCWQRLQQALCGASLDSPLSSTLTLSQASHKKEKNTEITNPQLLLIPFYLENLIRIQLLICTLPYASHVVLSSCTITGI